MATDTDTDTDDVIPLARFTAALGRLRGTKRLDAILSAKDPAALVAELPVQDLYFLIKEVGIEDAGQLVEMATADQFQGFLDLDVWAADRVREDATRPWLTALLEAGFEKVGAVWAALDPELTALILQRWTRIYSLAEEEVPDDEEPPFWPAPDRFFMVKITATDEDTIRLVERLLDDLYRADQVQARHTLRASMSEPGPELEEMCHRWRSGRMQDLGYADYYEALEVYRPIDLTSVKIGEGTPDGPTTPGQSAPPATLPATLADPTIKRGFFGDVLARVTDADEARRIEGQLVMLVNQVLSADRVEPGDLVAVTPTAGRAAATVSIALETLARGDVDRGVEALRTVSLNRLHRLGHSLTLQLSRLLAALGARAARAEEPYSSIATALRTHRPVFSLLLEDKPGPGTRPFARIDDIRRAAAAIARLASQVLVVHDLAGADPAKLGPAVTLGDVGRTVLVHLSLGHGIAARPLSVAEVKEFVRSPRDPVRAEGELRAAATERGLVLPAEFSAAIAAWMAELETRLARIAPDQALDARILDGLLLESN